MRIKGEPAAMTPAAVQPCHPGLDPPPEERKFAIATGLRHAAFLVELTRPELQRQDEPNLGLLRWSAFVAKPE
ncbi:hypothetical protein [Mesorhizobium sp. YR577]|uniref:hypothetical protein n=1 Tax=Mesorhizobium sp. YR577 TaxID=1884373 RepID=UPI001AECAD77|nr:hypothetical protein [Mesorhizobium sp. YR577]